MNTLNIKLIEKLKKVKLLLLDVDGVLTRGEIIYSESGSEIKVFNVKDGLGIRLLMKEGIEIGIVTGRSSKALRRRCKNLGIEHIFEGVFHKGGILGLITKKLNINANDVAFIGDDLVDISLMRLIGVSIAVADAHELVIENADITTIKGGGQGAVREICEAILKARGSWTNILEQFKQNPKSLFLDDK